MAMNTKAQVQLLRGNMPQLKGLTLEEGALFYEKTSGILFTSSGSDGHKLGYVRGRDARRDGFGTTIYVGPDGSNDNYGFTKDDAVHCIARAIDVSAYLSDRHGVFIVLLGDVNWFDEEYVTALDNVQGGMSMPCMITIQSDASLSQPAHLALGVVRVFNTCISLLNLVLDSVEHYGSTQADTGGYFLCLLGCSSIYLSNCTLNNNHYKEGLYISDCSYMWMNSCQYNIGNIGASQSMVLSLGSATDIYNSQINGTFSLATLYAAKGSYIGTRNISGNCIGKRFVVRNCSSLDTYGSGPNAIPGTIGGDADSTSIYV